ncbi:MAG TPA: type II toxin-antitoxin system RelE/ParE family toxin [Rubrivivax sp.]|mgnify:CR=1 FL=1|nr:type II toxin-antitoxin system RelE/ParE family toxin [Rubrivivax sp.]
MDTARRVPLVVRPQAQADIDDAIGHYLLEAGEDVAARLADAVVAAFERLARNPGLGSPREGLLPAAPGLRSRSLRPWPYLIFCVQGGQMLDVVRMLHGARDIPVTLAEPDA